MAQTTITVKLSPEEYALLTSQLADDVNTLEARRKDRSNGLEIQERQHLQAQADKLRTLLKTL